MILLYTNAKAFESANMETIVTFLSLSIFGTAYADFRCTIKSESMQITPIL
jgi:hypothetical protein